MSKETNNKETKEILRMMKLSRARFWKLMSFLGFAFLGWLHFKGATAIWSSWWVKDTSYHYLYVEKCIVPPEIVFYFLFIVAIVYVVIFYLWIISMGHINKKYNIKSFWA